MSNQQSKRGCGECQHTDYHLFSCPFFKKRVHSYVPVPVLDSERSPEQPRCPRCGSANVEINNESGGIWCRSCNVATVPVKCPECSSRNVNWRDCQQCRGKGLTTCICQGSGGDFACDDCGFYKDSEAQSPERHECAGLEGCHELEGVMYDLFVHDPKCPKNAQASQVSDAGRMDGEGDDKDEWVTIGTIHVDPETEIEIFTRASQPQPEAEPLCNQRRFGRYGPKCYQPKGHPPPHIFECEKSIQDTWAEAQSEIEAIRQRAKEEYRHEPSEQYTPMLRDIRTLLGQLNLVSGFWESAEKELDEVVPETHRVCPECGHSDGVDRSGQCVHKIEPVGPVAVWDDNHCGHCCTFPAASGEPPIESTCFNPYCNDGKVSIGCAVDKPLITTDCPECTPKKRGRQSHDPTRFVDRSFTMLWNEGHSIRLIKRDDPASAISIPWTDIPALYKLLELAPEVSDASAATPLTVEAARPKIVCLCGSTKFMEAFQNANLKLTLEGKIVLSVGTNTRSDAELTRQNYFDDPAIKVRLDELHKRKIDLADEVFVLNVGGYIGESTRSEIEYAEEHGKPVYYLEAAGG